MSRTKVTLITPAAPAAPATPAASATRCRLEGVTGGEARRFDRSTS